MAIKMVFEPRKTVIWADFSQNFPRHSIAVDGYCAGPPQFDARRCVLNINHHEGVDRLATRASCDQAFVAVADGLYDTFRDKKGPDAALYCNDCDQDVALASYILTRPHLVDHPRLRGLIRICDLMDTSMGIMPHRSRWQALRQLAWATEPYTKARTSGRLPELDGEGMMAVVEAVHRRLDDLISGRRIRFRRMNTHFETIGGGKEWTFVRECGSQARIGMAEHGIRAFVALVHEDQETGVYRYSIGRLSLFIPFPQEMIFTALNQAEGIAADDLDHWGGGPTAGGSPRKRGSRLNPSEVEKIVNACVNKHRRQIGLD